MKKYIIGVFVLLFSQLSVAQNQIEYSGFFDSYYYRYINFTAGGGATAYWGDLSEGEFPAGMNVSLGAHYKIWPRVMFGVEFNYLTLGADSDPFVRRDITFRTTGFEFLAMSKLFIIDDIVRVARDRNKAPRFFKPYVFGGIGALMYNAVSVQHNPIYADSAYFYGERPPGQIAFVIPAGVGISFYINPQFSILTEFGYRFTFTDHIDDVKYRGNPDKNDAYALVNLKLQFTPKPPNYKRKRKPSGQVPPSNPGGGGGESPADAPPKDAQPRDTEPDDEQDPGAEEEPEMETEPEAEPEYEYEYDGWD